MDTFLPPIENPSSRIMKMVYNDVAHANSAK
jgi:hypothetical protein